MNFIDWLSVESVSPYLIESILQESVPKYLRHQVAISGGRSMNYEKYYCTGKGGCLLGGKMNIKVWGRE